jgi:hypothetical protein
MRIFRQHIWARNQILALTAAQRALNVSAKHRNLLHKVLAEAVAAVLIKGMLKFTAEM